MFFFFFALLILIGDVEVRGVEKFRDKYYLDETEAHGNGMPFNVTLHIVRESWFPSRVNPGFLIGCLHNDAL